MEQKNIEKYISEIYCEDKILTKEVFSKSNASDFYCPVIDTYTAKFLEILVEAIKPKEILELGTSIGYSTTIIANTIKTWNGKVTTVEKSKKALRAASENFDKYDVSNNIEIVEGDVRSILPNMKESYDMIFVDLFNDVYPDILNECIRLLKVGGILIADDTLFPILKENTILEYSNGKIHDFNKLLAKNKNMISTILPFSDGITVAIKMRK